jgi:ElaB/YqjD/DUF883 family membrane-anchored ribosome-binding protein
VTLPDGPNADRKTMEARVMNAKNPIGETIGEQGQWVAAAAAAPATDPKNGATSLDATQAWSQAGKAAEEIVDAVRRAAGSASQRISDNPLLSVLVGCALGYAAGWWIHGRLKAAG